MKDEASKRRAYRFGNCSLTLEFGDITSSQADVIVSSDDYRLTMGGGVSAAIRRTGGEAVMFHAAKRIPANLGDVIVTTAGNLPASYIFHAITIGPQGRAKDPSSVLEMTTQKCFALLNTLGLNSIALPAIGAGLAGFSYEDVAVQMSEHIVSIFRTSQQPLHATIYLYDRFERASPIDFVRFFEEFSIRVRTFDASVQEDTRSDLITSVFGKVEGRKVEHQDTATERQRLMAELAELSQRRDELETTLVRHEGGLGERQQQEIERKLQEIHRRRLTVLSQMHERKGDGFEVFLSYAHEDEELRIELGKHLRALEHGGLIRTWHDRMINPGTEWKNTIDKRLERSGLVLLLISADFLDSKYCYEVEMKRALERHEYRESLVIPIILRPVVWANSPFAKLQVLPKDGRPVTEWSNQDAAFVNITEGIRVAVEDLLASRA
jgi:O-acetyl-ADP-ribose deacetylase (regulator of RNase III)